MYDDERHRNDDPDPDAPNERLSETGTGTCQTCGRAPAVAASTPATVELRRHLDNIETATHTARADENPQGTMVRVRNAIQRARAALLGEPVVEEPLPDESRAERDQRVQDDSIDRR
jgi:hypothetical protein